MKLLLLLLLLLTPNITYAEDKLYDVDLQPKQTYTVNTQEFITKNLGGKVDLICKDMCSKETYFFRFTKKNNSYWVWTADSSIYETLPLNITKHYIVTVDDNRQIKYMSTTGMEVDNDFAIYYHTIPDFDADKVKRQSDELFKREESKHGKKRAH